MPYHHLQWNFVGRFLTYADAYGLFLSPMFHGFKSCSLSVENSRCYCEVQLCPSKSTWRAPVLANSFRQPPTLHTPSARGLSVFRFSSHGWYAVIGDVCQLSAKWVARPTQGILPYFALSLVLIHHSLNEEKLALMDVTCFKHLQPASKQSSEVGPPIAWHLLKNLPLG